ncbi:MAG: hypothetical protein M3Y08_01390, partial [Fibrobacterota bacterium]|nr:hypothetical protein [Fibrobacterota bacterium]
WGGYNSAVIKNDREAGGKAWCEVIKRRWRLEALLTRGPGPEPQGLDLRDAWGEYDSAVIKNDREAGGKAWCEVIKRRWRLEALLTQAPPTKPNDPGTDPVQEGKP